MKMKPVAADHSNGLQGKFAPLANDTLEPPPPMKISPEELKNILDAHQEDRRQIGALRRKPSVWLG